MYYIADRNALNIDSNKRKTVDEYNMVSTINLHNPHRGNCVIPSIKSYVQINESIDSKRDSTNR